MTPRSAGGGRDLAHRHSHRAGTPDVASDATPVACAGQHRIAAAVLRRPGNTPASVHEALLYGVRRRRTTLVVWTTTRSARWSSDSRDAGPTAAPPSSGRPSWLKEPM